MSAAIIPDRRQRRLRDPFRKLADRQKRLPQAAGSHRSMLARH
jgi:hypothetical protein